MLFLSLHDIFVIKLSLNSTPYFNLLPESAGKEEQFISFLETLKLRYDGFFDWSLALNRTNEEFIYHRLEPGVIDSFIITEWEGMEDLEKLMDLQPKGWIWNPSFDFLREGGNGENPKTGERWAQVSLKSKPRAISLALLTEALPQEIQKSSATGVDTLILKSKDKPVNEERLQKLIHAAKVAVDLGMKVGIGEGLDFEDLNTVLNRVPHIEEVQVGTHFFSKAFSIGIENTFDAYIQLLSDY